MIKHKDHFHGSDLEKIEQIYGIKKEEIVSFSANVNPLGVSPLLRTALSEQIDVITTGTWLKSDSGESVWQSVGKCWHDRI